jgi:NADPH:quinone reductase-like Zn-dependent oxidoreductase
MKALMRDRYGSPDVLRWSERETPEVPDEGLLVRVRAASINPADRYNLFGTPVLMRMQGGLRKPKDPFMGGDVAGVVEAVGAESTDFHPGDEVFGRTGELGELSPVSKFARKPAGLSFEEAAAIPVAGITALQGLRDKGELQPGQRVLVNGASGGVGTFAVQIAKVLGAEVTGVCSTRNVEQTRSLGADHVVDYTKEDFTSAGIQHDLILDVAGSRSWKDSKRALKPDGIHVIVGAPKGGRFLGPLGHMLSMKLRARRDSRTFILFVAKLNADDLTLLASWAAEGRVRPVLDRTYPIEEVADAFRYLDEGHAPGKILLSF